MHRVCTPNISPGVVAAAAAAIDSLLSKIGISKIKITDAFFLLALLYIGSRLAPMISEKILLGGGCNHVRLQCCLPCVLS